MRHITHLCSTSPVQTNEKSSIVKYIWLQNLKDIARDLSQRSEWSCNPTVTIASFKPLTETSFINFQCIFLQFFWLSWLWIFLHHYITFFSGVTSSFLDMPAKPPKEAHYILHRYCVDGWLLYCERLYNGPSFFSYQCQPVLWRRLWRRR